MSYSYRIAFYITPRKLKFLNRSKHKSSTNHQSSLCLHRSIKTMVIATMKFVTFLLAPLSVYALSNVAPGTFERRIKSSPSEDFDPTAGDNAALIYNNNDEVWVPQVKYSLQKFRPKKSLQMCFILTKHYFFLDFNRELDLGEIENHQRCEVWSVKLS